MIQIRKIPLAEDKRPISPAPPKTPSVIEGSGAERPALSAVEGSVQRIPPKRGFLLFFNTIFALFTLFNVVKIGVANLAREQGLSQTNFLVLDPDSLSRLKETAGFNYAVFYFALLLFVVVAFFWFAIILLRRQERLSNLGIVLVVANIVYLLALTVFFLISFLLTWGLTLIE